MSFSTDPPRPEFYPFKTVTVWCTSSDPGPARMESPWRTCAYCKRTQKAPEDGECRGCGAPMR